MDKELCTEQAYRLYTKLHKKIEEAYILSDKYPIFKGELEEILCDAEEYMHDLFIGIALAQDGINDEEKAFIERLTNLSPSSYTTDSTSKIESIVSRIPLYVELGYNVDRYTGNTNYFKQFMDSTREICKLLQDVDGNTYSSESSFMYGVTDKLEKIFKEREKENEK